jgi:type II secretory pathway component PulM
VLNPPTSLILYLLLALLFLLLLTPLQERAEARVSFIHAELKDSEQELVVLERELQEIDQIERDLVTLTHERNILASGITNAAGMPRTAGKGAESLVLGHESTPLDDPDLDRR